VEGKRDGIETRHTSRDECPGLAAWMGFACTRFLQRAIAGEPSRVKARETRSIESVSGYRSQITGACYCLLSFREVHDLAGDSGR